MTRADGNLSRGPSPVHVVILRRVRAGREAEFERRVTSFFEEAASETGVCGAYLIKPIAGSGRGEYGVLRSFRSEDDMRAFYSSAVYHQWRTAVAPLVEGEARMQRLHGMEAFFTGGAPPRWKMAVLTWIAVNAAVYPFSVLAAIHLGALPAIASFLLVNALVVAALTWILMPVLTRVFERWLLPDTHIRAEPGRSQHE
jgi:antibiotic biosynthesis monooxygenase (ABM) superfamily enzyme